MALKYKKLRTHSVQEIIPKNNAEIGIYTIIKTNITIQNNRLDLFIYNKKPRKFLLIKTRITNQDPTYQKQQRMRRYDPFKNIISFLYKCKNENNIVCNEVRWNNNNFQQQIYLDVEVYLITIPKKTLTSNHLINLVKGNNIEGEGRRSRKVNNVRNWEKLIIIIIIINCCTNYLLPNSSMSHNYVEF